VLDMLRALPAPVLPDEPAPALPQIAGKTHQQAQAAPSRHTPRQTHGASPVPHMTSQLAGKDAVLAALRERVATLEAQIAQLSTITVSVNGSLVAASDLPAVLHLDTLHTQVQQATITVARVEKETPIPEPVRHELVAQPTPQQKALEAAAPELLYSEQKLLARLVAQVKALSSSEKALFVWLVEHDGQQVSSRQLADAVGIDVRVTWSDRTKRLVKLPYIQQWGAHQFWYRARFREYCHRCFAAQTDQRAIARELLAVDQAR
jgi:hypothetical protein